MRNLTVRLPQRGDHDLAVLELSVDPSLYIPRVLEESGLTSWELDSVSTFLALLDCAPAGDFFDIGANVGVFSWLAARFGGRGVTAFEPTPAIADTIRSVAAGNELEIDVEEIALADHNGTAQFYLSNRSDCSNSLASGFRKADEVLDVAVETLDSYAERTGKRPSVLKIDTETTEPDVLRGALSYIKEHRPWMIVEVLAGKTEAAMTEIFEPLGYQWYQITHEAELVRRQEIFGCRAYKFPNWLFAPATPDASLWQAKTGWRKALTECDPRTPVEVPALSYYPTVDKNWGPTDWSHFKASVDRGYAKIVSSCDDDQRVQFFHGEAGFDTVAKPKQRIDVRGEQDYLFEVDFLRSAGEMPRVHFIVMEYDERERVQTQRIFLTEGLNKLRLRSQPMTTNVRVAFRVAGSGAARLGKVKLFEI